MPTSAPVMDSMASITSARMASVLLTTPAPPTPTPPALPSSFFFSTKLSKKAGGLAPRRFIILSHTNTLAERTGAGALFITTPSSTLKPTPGSKSPMPVLSTRNCVEASFAAMPDPAQAPHWTLLDTRPAFCSCADMASRMELAAL